MVNIKERYIFNLLSVGNYDRAFIRAESKPHKYHSNPIHEEDTCKSATQMANEIIDNIKVVKL